MTNAEKFKTAEEREKAFGKWCESNKIFYSYCDATGAVKYGFNHFAWLDLETEEEKPLPCMICGRAVDIHKIGDWHTRSQVQCTCGYRGAWCDSMDEAIALHNRMARHDGGGQGKRAEVMYAIEVENPRGEKFVEGRFRTRFCANYNLADRIENACDGFRFRIVKVDDNGRIINEES